MTTQNTPILDSWNSFNEEVVSRRDLHPAAVQFIKDTFLAGAFTCFQACTRASENEETAHKTLEAISAEMDSFLEEKMQSMILAMLKGEKNEH